MHLIMYFSTLYEGTDTPIDEVLERINDEEEVRNSLLSEKGEVYAKGKEYAEFIDYLMSVKTADLVELSKEGIKFLDKIPYIADVADRYKVEMWDDTVATVNANMSDDFLDLIRNYAQQMFDRAGVEDEEGYRGLVDVQCKYSTPIGYIHFDHYLFKRTDIEEALLFGSAAEGEIFFSIIDDKTRYVYGFSFRNDKFGIITKDSLEEARTMQDTEPHDDLEYVYCECTPVDIKEPGKTYVAMCDYYA